MIYVFSMCRFHPLPTHDLIELKIYDSIFGFFKCVDWILICGSCFVLFLVVECNNPIENISNSMTVMICSFIKSWVGNDKIGTLQKVWNVLNH